MKRLLGLACLFFICNFLGAQPGDRSKPTPAQMTKLLQQNLPLMDKLIDGSLVLAKNPKNPLEKSESYRQTIVELERQIKQAAEEGNNKRALEMIKHLGQLLDKGLLPNLTEARDRVSPGHPDEKQLFELRDLTNHLTDSISEVINTHSIGKNPEAIRFLESLHLSNQQMTENMKAKPRE